MTDYSLTITVNFPDDKEMEFEAAATGASLGEAIDFALKANDLTEKDYTSLVVVVTGNATYATALPTLRVVK